MPRRPSAGDPRIPQLLQSAQGAARVGDAAAQRKALRAAVALAPADPAALNALAVRLIADGDGAQAGRLLERATRADARAPDLWLNLAKAHQVRGDDPAARAALDAALAIDQRHFAARVRSAEHAERTGDGARAAADWSAVLQLAVGLHADQARQVDALLTHARGFVAERTRRLAEAVDAGLAERRSAVPAAARRRFEGCVDAMLGRRRIYRPEPFGMHFPFLPAEEFVPRDMLPWLPELERRTGAIAAEIAGVLDAGGTGFAPYVDNPPGTPPDKWSALDRSTRWSALYLYKYGKPDAAALARFPATAAALAAVPLADIPGRAPTAFFSLLEAGARIPPHTGVTNTRTIVHLPLIVPHGCGFRVGGETRAWVEGEAFGFDDTIEHEAWNDSAAPRVVLIMDAWNPYLTAVERDLLRDFYTAADASGLSPEPR